MYILTLMSTPLRYVTTVAKRSKNKFTTQVYSVSQKNPRWGFLTFFPKRLGIFSPNFTRLLLVPIYARAQIFIQLSANLMKLCPIKRDHPVHTTCAKCPPSAETHAGIFCQPIFPKQLGSFSPNFTCLGYYAFLSTLDWTFLFQLSPTATKLCHIKCDHHHLACVSSDGWMVDILRISWWSRLIWHKFMFIKVADNWIQICSPA